MGLFGSSAVRILGQLTINGKVLVCPACEDDGKGIGHTLRPGAKGTATVECGNDPGHQFAADGLTNKAIAQMPKRGPFELRLDGVTISGIAARPGKTPKDQAPDKGGSALAKGATPPALGSKGKPGSTGGSTLGGVLIAGLNTVSALAGTATATVGAVGQAAGAAASTANAAARVGTEGIGLARDSVKAGTTALQSAAEARKDDRRHAEAARVREHQAAMRPARPARKTGC